MSTQTGLNVEDQLRASLRQAAVQHVLANPKATPRLAVAFDVPEEAIQKMLAAPWWDLALAVDVAEVLGLSLVLKAESPIEAKLLL